MPKPKSVLLGIGAILACILVIVGIPAIVLSTLGPSEPEPVSQEQTDTNPALPEFRMKTYLSARPNVPKATEEETTTPAETTNTQTVPPEQDTQEGLYRIDQEPSEPTENVVQEATPAPEVTPSSDAIFWLGDSVSVLSKSEVLKAFPNAEINAVSGRTLAEGLPEVQAKQGQAWAPKAVVIELGANTVADEDDFTKQYCAILDLIPTNVPVFAVTIKTVGTYHNMHNACIKTQCDLRSNLYMVDWYALAAAHEEWLSDGCHPTETGAQEFVKLIQDTVNTTLSKQTQ